MKTLIEDLIQTEATIMQIVSAIKTIKPECGNQLAGGTCVQRAITALQRFDAGLEKIEKEFPPPHMAGVYARKARAGK